MSQTTQNPSTGEFTADSFNRVTETDKHYLLPLSNGKERKLSKTVCAVEISLEQYRALILEKKAIGPFLFTRNDGTKFESMVLWITKPGKRELANSMTFLEGGQSKFLSFKRIAKGDPNTQEDVLDHMYSWRFPSVGNKTLSKKVFEVELTFAEAQAIIDQKGSGLTRQDWVGKTGKKFAANLKWDIEKGTYKVTFINSPKETAAAEVETPANGELGEEPPM